MKQDGVFHTIRIFLGKETQVRKFKLSETPNEVDGCNPFVGRRSFFMSQFWRKVQQQLLTLVQ